MRALRVSVLFLLLFVLTAGSVLAKNGGEDLGQQTLPANDGWASLEGGVTGGAGAAADHIYLVTNRMELVKALNNGVYPPTTTSVSNDKKIIYVAGVIDANVDDNNQPLTCDDYAQMSGFNWDAFLAYFHPDVWGRVSIPKDDPMDLTRIAARDLQKARVQISVGSNTTIVGLGKNATIRGAQLDIRGTRVSGVQVPRTNIIVRNITFEDTIDCFPAWSPTDGSLGSWNAEYDAIAVRESKNIWVDHNTFRDRETLDSLAPQVFGVLFQQHDGLVDITNASDLVTVSWNRFENHDKVMLIGSSDSGTTATRDVGKLNVTLHHNLFDGTGQRTPRVRFGKVHVYNNYYKITDNPIFNYAWGVGIQSQLYAENNYFTIDQVIDDEPVTAADLISVFKGLQMFETGTRINGTPEGEFTDVVAAYNAANNPVEPLISAATWDPDQFYSSEPDPTQQVIPLVHSGAGPFNW